MSIGVAIPAAGLGRRMGGARKPFLELRGQPILRWALSPFLSHPDVVAVRVAVAEEEYRAPPTWLTRLDERIRVVRGGDTRMESVGRAIDELSEDIGLIAVHDAARPLLSLALLTQCAEVAETGVGAVAGRAATDTLKRVEGDSVLGTLDRTGIWRAETPQIFPAAMIREAYDRGRSGTLPSAESEFTESVTDDASLVERLGYTVRMVESDGTNLKVTHPEDVYLAGFLLDRSGSD